jgi:RHS repeat-associated protein
MEDGPGYTGHVTDAATGLVYMQQRYYDPLCGCFLSTDPVTALKGTFNRYWYANNEPYKFIDPDGRVAQLIKDADGNVTLQIKVKFVGPGATKAAIKAIEKRIESLHTSGFKIDLVPVTGKAGADTNIMTLGNGYKKKDFPVAGEGVKPIGGNQYGGNEGYINSQAGNYISAAAHDTLHFAGMQDHYHDLPGSKPGARRTEIMFGYDESDIMGSRQGTTVSEASFQDVLDNWSTQFIGP